MTPEDNVDSENVSDVIDKVITIYDNDTDRDSAVETTLQHDLNILSQ